MQMKIEEKSLLERYGQAYRDYSSRVKRLIPYVF
jgi:protein-S-isoprenylcysteine O-methyltransferase Ste14